MRVKPMKPQRGLTLIELMIGLVIAAIVLFVGVPSLYNLFMTTRMANAANSVLAHLQYARLEAVGRNMRVTVCPSADGNSCDAAASPQDWSQGYIVATLDNSGNLLDVLRRVDAEEIANLDIDSCGRQRFIFQADGSAAGTNGRVRIADPGNHARYRIIVINAVGRAYVGGDGMALVCP